MSVPGVKNPLADHEKQLSTLDAKQADEIESARNSDISFDVLDSERDIVTNIISVHDDLNLNPWTLRAFVVGFGLSAFGGVLGKSFAFISHLLLKYLNSRDLLLQTSMNLLSLGVLVMVQVAN